MCHMRYQLYIQNTDSQCVVKYSGKSGASRYNSEASILKTHTPSQIMQRGRIRRESGKCTGVIDR